MGTYLSTPASEKYKEWGEDLNCPVKPIRWAVVDMQGWRKSMEDAHVVESTVPYPKGLPYLSSKDIHKLPKAKVFGVFDGHGGPEVARFCQLYLVSVLTQQRLWQEDSVEESGQSDDPAKTGIGEALIASFHALDRLIDDPSRRDEIIRLRTQKAPPTERREADSIPPEKPIESTEAEIPKVMDLAQADATTVNVLPPPPPPTGEVQPNDASKHENVAPSVEDSKENAQSTGEDKEVPETADSSISSADDTSASSGESNSEGIETLENTNPADSKDDAVSTQDAARVDSGKSSPAEEGQSENSEEYDSDEAVGTEEAAAEREQELEEEEDSKDEDVNINPYDGEIQVAQGSNDGHEADPASIPASKVTVMFQRLLNMNENQSGQMVISVADEDEPVDAKSDNSDPAEQAQRAVSAGPSASAPSIFQNGRLICNLPDHPIHAGCTAVVAVLLGMTLTVANAGDSRAVLCREGGVTEPLSFDHKPQQPREMNRINNAGGFVNRFGRVNGNLNLSRSIGDLKYKQVPGIPPKDQMITAEPDILQVTLNPKDEFIVLGCDGIWDCLTNEKCVEFVRDRIDTKEPKEIGAEMLDTILSDDPRATQGIGGDNMTVLIVDLQPQSRSYIVDPAWGPQTTAAL